MRSSRALPAVLLVLLLALAGWSYRSIFELGHLGWDAWPLMVTAKIESFADVVDTFTEELMDGRYPIGSFYRPVTNLAFAFDYARGGTDPLVYHQTDIAIVLLAGVLVYLVAQRLCRSAACGLAAAAFFAFHPVHFEALPVSARRADTLSVLFTLLAVWVASGPRARWRLVTAGFFALCAVGSKETGVLAVPLVFGMRFLVGAEDAPPERSRALTARALCALRETLWVCAAILVFVVARTLVLDGFGGHTGSAIIPGLLSFPSLAPHYLRDLLAPQPWGLRALKRPELAAILGSAVVLAGALVLRVRAGRGDAWPLIYVLFWVLCTLAITGISGETRSWYSVPMLVPYALAAGWLLGRGLALCAQRRLVAGPVAVLVSSVLLASHLAFSGLARTYPTWNLIDGEVTAFLEGVHGVAESWSGGQVVAVKGLPVGYEMKDVKAGVRSAAGIEGYGVQAWFDLEHPELNVRVVNPDRLPKGQPIPPPDPDEVLLLVTH